MEKHTPGPYLCDRGEPCAPQICSGAYFDKVWTCPRKESGPLTHTPSEFLPGGTARAAIAKADWRSDMRSRTPHFEEDPLRAMTWRIVAGGIAGAAAFYALGWLVWTAFGPV